MLLPLLLFLMYCFKSLKDPPEKFISVLKRLSTFFPQYDQRTLDFVSLLAIHLSLS